MSSGSCHISCRARFGAFVPVAVAAALAIGCDGSSRSPAPLSPDDVDDLELEVSQLWDSAPRGVTISAEYEFAAPTSVRVTDFDVRGAGLGSLRPSRIALYQDERRLLTDDFGDEFLGIELGVGEQAIPIGQASRTLGTGCNLTLAHWLRIDDEIAQGRLAWIFEETAALDDNGSPSACSDALDPIVGSLMSASQAEFPYDLITLLELQAVDSAYFGQLRSWTVSHSQVVAKYFRAIGDSGYELAGRAQRIPLDMFESPDTRADQLVSQLNP